MYRLYIGAYRQTEEPYTHYEGQYLLIFADKKPIGDFREVPPARECNLTKSEKRWLMNCKLAVNAKAVKTNETEYAAFLSEFCDRLEQELKKEERKAKENGNADKKGNADKA